MKQFQSCQPLESQIVLRTSKISILPSKLVFFQPAHSSNILNLIHVLTQRELYRKVNIYAQMSFYNNCVHVHLNTLL